MKKIETTGLIILTALLVLSCQPTKQNDESEPSAEERIFPVKTMIVEKSAVTRTLEYTGNLTAYKEIYFAPASPGRIEKIHVEIGDRIKKGQLLVESDKTQLAQAKIQLANARDTYDRIKTLYDQGSSFEQQFEQVKTQYELAQENVEFLLENTTLASPINGIVTGKYFENGEMFSGAPNTQVGKAAVLTLMQINPLKVLVSISQTHYTSIKKGMKAMITCDAVPGQLFEGKVANVYPTINPMTRTFQTEILVPNPREILRPGMSATIQIEIREDEALMLPAISILKQSGTNNRYVFVHENGTARQINVKPGKRLDDQIEAITDELTEGMELIIEGQARLIDGSAVQAESR